MPTTERKNRKLKSTSSHHLVAACLINSKPSSIQRLALHNTQAFFSAAAARTGAKYGCCMASSLVMRSEWSYRNILSCAQVETQRGQQHLKLWPEAAQPGDCQRCCSQPLRQRRQPQEGLQSISTTALRATPDQSSLQAPSTPHQCPVCSTACHSPAGLSPPATPGGCSRA